MNILLLIGKTAAIIGPIAKIVRKYIDKIWTYVSVFYEAFNYVESLNIPPSIINELSLISSKPLDDFKTIMVRAYIRDRLHQNEFIFKDAIINTLIEVIYYMRKMSK